jgi:hypothetical protein
VNRKISVEFAAELGQWKKNLRQGAEDLNQFKGEAGKAREELGRFGQAATQAGQEVSRFTRDAQGRMRDARGRFVSELGAAGKQAGEAFGKNANKEIDRHLRKASGSSGRAIRHPWGALLAVGVAEAAPALEVIPPLLAAIGGGLAALPSLAVGAAAAIGSIRLGTIGFGEAITDVFADQPAGGGGGGGGGADRTAAAERRLAAAQRESREAQLDVNRARFEAARELRDMRLELAGLRLDEDAATRAVTDARRDLAEAVAAESVPEDDVARATLRLAEAEEHLRDVQRTRGHTAADIARAELEIQDAQRELAQALARAAIPDDPVGDADLRLRQAQQSLREIQTRARDAAEDNAKAQKAGVEGSDRVQEALKRQAAAAEAVISAQEALAAATSRAGAAAAKQVTAYDKLSPNAKKVVDEVKKLKPELIDLKNLAQDRIFDKVNLDVRDLGKTWLPIARQQAVIFGDDWNTMIHRVTGVANSPAFVGGVKSALGAWDRFFDGVNARIPETGRSLSTLLSESTPFVDRFNAKLLDGLDQFNAQVEEARANGELEDFFEGAADQADALFDLAYGIVRLVAQVADYGASSDILRRMADAVERLADGGTEMDRLKAILSTINEVLAGTRELVHDVGDSLGDTLADPDTRAAIEQIFDALGLVAGVLGGVIDLFNFLPGPLQQAILLGAGLYLAFRKIAAIASPMGDAIGRASDKLRDHGKAGDIAARSLDGVRRNAGKAAGAFIAVQAAGGLASAIFGGDLAPNMALVNDQMGRFAVTAQFGGEAARVFGEDASELGDALNDKLATGFESGADSVLRWGAELLNLDDAWTRDEERIRTFDAALADLVRSGHGDQALKAIENAARNAGKGVDEVKGILPEYSQAAKDAAEKGNELAESNRSIERSFDDLANAIRAQVDDSFALEEAEDKIVDVFEEGREVLMRHRDEISKNGVTAQEAAGLLRLQRDKGRELFDAYVDLMIQNQKTGKSNDGLIGKFREAARQMGLTEDQVNDLIGRFGAVKTSIDKIPKDVNINVAVNATGGFGQVGYMPSQYTVVWRRWGGITEHARMGLLKEAEVFAGGPTRYGFAEAGTGGEAFVPRRGIPARSTAILRQAAGWYDMDVVPKQRSMTYSAPLTGGGSGSSMPSPQAYADAVADRVGPLLAAAAGVQVVPLVDAEGVALLVRRGEQRRGRRG